MEGAWEQIVPLGLESTDRVFWRYGEWSITRTVALGMPGVPLSGRESDPDPALVRALMVQRGYRIEGDGLPVTPPEIRLYVSIVAHERRLREIQVLTEYRQHDDVSRTAERDRRAWLASEAYRIRAAREWGIQAGYRVGMRGRIPADVWTAFLKAVDRGELQAPEPEFAVGNDVTHERFPDRVGRVVQVEAEHWAPEHIYTVQWTSERHPQVPYRSGLVRFVAQLGEADA